MKIFKSFKLALNGILYCINNERHMRIHTVVAVYILIFSFIFNLNKIEFIIVAVTIGVVITSEMLNTAVEELTDLSTTSYHPLAKVAKDIAAGAVLVCAVISIIIGVVIFYKPEQISIIYNYICSNLWVLLIFILITTVAVIYVILGPKGIKEKFKLAKGKNNN